MRSKCKTIRSKNPDQDFIEYVLSGKYDSFPERREQCSLEEYLDELEREQEMDEEEEWEDDIIRANRNSGMFINDDGEWEQEEIEDELL